jgi:hypothetical protein
VYIHIPQKGWRLKPNRSDQVITVSQNGDWECDVTVEKDDHKANYIKAFIVPQSFNPIIETGKSLLPKRISKVSVANCFAYRKK